MKIEKGIPIPLGGGRGESKYPFPQMKPGDSIWAPAKRVTNAVNMWGKRHKAKFTSRKEDKGYRIWRVK